VLGGQLGSFAGEGGAATFFADAGATLPLWGRWSLAGDVRRGWTRIAPGGIRAQSDLLETLAWSVDLSGLGVLRLRDRFGFRIAQPLRVSQGGLTLSVPVSYDYATRQATFAQQAFNLSPDGREIVAEAAWSVPSGPGWLHANLFWRTEPGHRQDAPDDKGAAVRFTVPF
jgi:hypothetical protein